MIHYQRIGTIFIPINKPLWTSSYVICSAGFACLTLAFFVYMVDIKNITRPIAPLTMYGTNPLFIYVLSWVWVASYVFVSIGDVPLHQFMFNSLALILSDKMASLVFALAHVILFWWFSKLLYERNIFIKI